MQLRLLVWLGAEPGRLAPGLTLALTYLVHSLLWTCAAALLVRAKGLSSTTRHLFWKVALFGPLFSAGLADVATSSFEHSVNSAPTFVQEFAAPQPVPSGGPTRAGVFGACCLAAAALGVLRFTGSIWQVRRRLRGRNALTDLRLLGRFEHLRSRMALRRVALSESDAVASPLVIGSAEVCLPRAALDALTDAELDAVLAHELAHIERGDGLWFPLVGALQSVLWLNPLNHWISARFRASAELACDDRAVELTGNRLSLARALVHVATAAVFAQRCSMLPSIAHSKSTLLPRVRRLSSGSLDVAPFASRRERLSAIVTVTTLAALSSTLSIQVAQAHAKAAKTSEPIRSGEPSALASAAALDMFEQSKHMLDLEQRARAVATLLTATEQLPAAAQGGSPEATRVLELSQQLRHIRATQLWLEQRLVSAAN